MTVFRKELRAGAVSFLVWSAVVGGLMAVCVGLYPSMAGSMEDMSALFAGMGEFSAAFGLDKLQFGSIMGFYGTECGNILGLGGAFYAAVTAMGLLAGEEGGHTAEFLLTHPVSRVQIAAEKLAALFFMVLGMNLICLACGAAAFCSLARRRIGAICCATTALCCSCSWRSAGCALACRLCCAGADLDWPWGWPPCSTSRAS